MKRSAGIRTKIFAVVLPAMLTPPLWIGYQASQRELARAQASGRAEAYSLLGEIGAEVSRTFRRAEDDLEALGRLPSIEDYHAFLELELAEEAEQHRLRIREAATSAMESRPEYRSLGVLDTAGKPLTMSGDTEAIQAALSARVDHSACAGWHETIPAHGPPGIARCRLLFDKWGVPRGAIVVLLDMEALGSKLGRLNPHEFHLLLLRAEQQLLPLAPTAAAALEGQPQLSWLIQNAGERPATLAASHEVFGGPSLPGDFRVGVMIPTAYLYAGVDEVRRNTTSQALFALLASVLLTGWLSRTLAGRLARLTEAAEAIGEGNFDHRISVTSSDELGMLAETFNQMTGKVQITEAALRQRIVEIEQARDQLIHAEKLSAIGTMASGVAHEIRSPLQTIAIKASTLRLHSKKAEIDRTKLARLADTVAEEVERANQIIHALQHYSRTSRPVLDLAVVDLSEVLSKAEVLAGTNTGTRRLLLDLGTAPPVLGDFNQLLQIVINLVNNGLDASAADGAVEVILEASAFTEAEVAQAVPMGEGSPFLTAKPRRLPRAGEAAAQITVTDHGSGISPEQLHRIFDPFFTTKAAGKGTGLGLSIALGIVSLHGGLLLVESEPGVGSQFILKFPASKETLDA